MVEEVRVAVSIERRERDVCALEHYSDDVRALASLSNESVVSFRRQMDRVLTEKLDVLAKLQNMAQVFTHGQLSHFDDSRHSCGDGVLDGSRHGAFSEEDEWETVGCLTSTSTSSSTASRCRRLQDEIVNDGGKIDMLKDSVVKSGAGETRERRKVYRFRVSRVCVGA